MLKSFAKYYKPHMRLFVFDLLCALLVAVCNLFYPILTKNIINVYVPDKNITLILSMCGVLLCIYILKIFFNYFILYWGHVLGVRIQGQMRKDMFSHMQKLPLSFFDDNKTGVLMSRLVNDLQDISELAHHGPEDIFLSLITLIGAFILLGLINIWLSLIVMFIIPFIIIFAVVNRVRMLKAFKKMREETGKINARVETSLTGVRVIKAYAGEKHEKEKFDAVNENFKSARSDAYKKMGIFHSGMEFMTDFLYFSVLLSGGLFFYFSLIDIGEFAAFILYIVMLIAPVRSLIVIFEQIQNGMTGFARFSEIMRTPVEKDGEDAALFTGLAGEIIFADVYFKYGGKDNLKEEEPDGQIRKEVLKGVSFKIEEGKTTALVGPSGCGKTTVCHLLMRFYDYGGGKIKAGGRDIADYTRESVRKKIGLVSQDVFIFDGTVRENIWYGNLSAGEDEIIESAKRANIHDFIMTLPEKYDTEVGERGVKLSGGQRQRLSIARAFLKNPAMLILDEATSALDNVTEAQIQKSLEELSRGRTTLVVAHRLSTIKAADKIIVMDDGRVIEEGTHAELIKKGGPYYYMNAGMAE